MDQQAIGAGKPVSAEPGASGKQGSSRGGDKQRRVKLTEARVRAITAAEQGKRIRVFDAEQPGLLLRVTDTGSKSWKLLRKIGGKVVEATIGGWPALPVEQARKEAARMLVDLRQGINPSDAKRAVRQEATLGELFAVYLEQHAKVHKRTWLGDEQLFKRYLVGWKGKRLSELTPMDVQDWHARIGKEHGQTAANRGHSLLRKMLRFAGSRGWQGSNPAVGVRRFREQSRERFLDGEELRALFAALDAEPEHTARDFFLLALLTGARRANVLGMRWEDVDVGRGLWRISGERSKNGQPLEVVLAPAVVELLGERRRLTGTSPWVLPSGASASGHLMEPKMAWRRILDRAERWRLVEMICTARSAQAPAVAQAFVAAEDEIVRRRLAAITTRIAGGAEHAVLNVLQAEAKALGLDPARARLRDVRIHDLRRTFGSWQMQGGASLPVIGKSLGHLSQLTTAIYARLSLDPVRQAVEQATTSMLEAGRPRLVRDPQVVGDA